MNILLQGMYFHPEVGGMEIHMLNLARYFVKAGNKVKVITSNSLKKKKKETYNGIIIIRTPFFGKNLFGWAFTTFFSIPAFLKKAKNADIIHGHDIAALLPCVLASILYKKPFVITLHSSHYIKVSKKLLFKPYLKHGLKKADCIFAASEEIKKITQQLVPNREVTALVNPVDTELFSPEVPPCINKEKDEFILVCPRRLVEKNGVHLLIEAIPDILSAHNVKLVIAGDGPLRTGIESRIKQLGIEKEVMLLGTIPNEEMPSILTSADLIVIPSLMEATSIAALESMASGKAIAASNVGGLPEIIDESVGFLMESGNPDDYTDKINIALSDVKLLKEKGRRARKRVLENWSAKKLAEYHIGVYKKLINRH
ncbi:glycosyltransferase family 4 protein [candidate division WOR-3 bacterium]|nr:glycosyltransferase family 4 protein [candidate division WOR-3 bacterium]